VGVDIEVLIAVYGIGAGEDGVQTWGGGWSGSVGRQRDCLLTESESTLRCCDCGKGKDNSLATTIT
jgi:hypothetical protein